MKAPGETFGLDAALVVWYGRNLTDMGQKLTMRGKFHEHSSKLHKAALRLRHAFHLIWFFPRETRSGSQDRFVQANV